MRGQAKHPEHGALPAVTRARSAVVPEHPGQATTPGAVFALQRLIGNARVGDVLGAAEQAGQAESQADKVRTVVETPGRPLEDTVRSEMEPLVGTTLGHVRIHTDQAAHESAESVAAHAYTSRSHIVFQRNRYDPSSEPGRRLLAHELTHAAQQQRGPVAGTDTGAGIAVSHPHDPFEREAEAVSDGVAAGLPAQRTTAAGGGTGTGTGEALPVARLMSLAEFQRQTPESWRDKRSSKIVPIEKALDAYHKIPQNNYTARRTQLTLIMNAVNDYGARSTSHKHQAAVDVLSNEVAEETREVRIPALIEEVLRQAEAHAQIYTELDAANQEADGLQKVRLLMAAQESVLTERQATGAGPDSDLSMINLHLATWINVVVGELGPDERERLVKDDVGRLRTISTDTGTAQLTRDVLSDLLAHEGSITFTTGQPGTSRNPGGAGYTLRHAAYQPEGETERLGSLAHEMTHVEAGESYQNTDILLLFPRDLPDQEIAAMAVQRKAAIDRLKTMLSGTSLSATQQDLVTSKLHYAVDPGKGVGRYALNYFSAKKIDAPTYQRLLAIEQLVKPNSSALVEYDTVITQILVYLRRWNVDQQDPFHAEVLSLAAGLRSDRSAARSANP